MQTIIITGSDEGETLTGSSSNEMFYGLGGTDFIYPGAGIDTIDGGNGGDILGYNIDNDISSGIYINAEQGLAVDPYGFEDTFLNIEVYMGTHKNDVFYGKQTDDLVGVEADAVGSSFDNYELFVGFAGDDYIDGQGGYDEVAYTASGVGLTIDLENSFSVDDGQGGIDTLYNIEGVEGSNFNDYIFGTSGANSLDGRLGNNTIDGRDGYDFVEYNGNGRDQLNVDLSQGSSTFIKSGNNDEIFKDTLISIEGVIGSANDDRISGDENNNTLYGLDGDDKLFGNGGEDILFGGIGDDWLYGGVGNDIIDGGEGFDRIDFRESLHAVEVDFSLNLATGQFIGNDEIYNIERVIGSDFNDTLIGSDNEIGTWESFTGGLGDDFINGAGGFDFVWFGRSNDAIDVNLTAGFASSADGEDRLISIEGIVGSNFSDTLIGSQADEFFLPDALGDNGAGTNFMIGGADIIDGREGIDTVSYDNTGTDDGFDPAGISADLNVGEVIDQIGNVDRLTNIENITGSAYGDSIRGNSEANHLEGRAGNDELYGDGGDDHLDGGVGDNILKGGEGNDTFFSDSRFAGVNTIYDSAGTDDTLQILDSTGRDSWRFYVTEDSIVRESMLGREDVMMFAEAGEQSIEYVTWIGNSEIDPLPNDDYENKLKLVTSVDVITDAHFIFAGSLDADTITIPEGLVADPSGGQWGEIYLDGGDDYLKLSGDFEYFSYGGTGNDRMIGADGDDHLEGQAGDDELHGGSGSDFLNGGEGYDTAVFEGVQADYEILQVGQVYSITDKATGDTDELHNLELLQFGDGTEMNIGYELVSGGSGDDWLIGGLDADLIATNGGDDYVYGLAGDDRIEISGSGNVVVDTGEGADEIVVAEDAQGSIEITTSGAGNTLLWNGTTEGGVSVNEHGDLLIGDNIYGLSGIVREQMVLDAQLNKYVVSDSGFDAIIFSDTDDDMIPDAGTFGSDHELGDYLTSVGHDGDNFIVAGRGADTIELLGGADQAALTSVMGDILNFDQSNGQSTTYSLSAINYNVVEGDRTDDNWDVLPQRIDNLGEVNVQVTYTTDEYGSETARVSYDGQEFDHFTSDHSVQRFETSGYHYDFLIIEAASEWEAPDNWDYTDGNFYPDEVKGVFVLLDTDDPSGLSQSDLFDKLAVQYVDGNVYEPDDFTFDGQQANSGPGFFKNVLDGYADDVSVADNSWETQNVSYGDELVFAWAREDVEITDHLNGYYEVEYIGEGADNGKVVEFTDIEKLVFEGGEGAPVEIQVIPGPVVGSAEWFVDNSWGGAAAGQDISFVDNNVELRVEGNTIKVYADVTVSETVMEMQSVKETYKDSRGRTKTRTVQKEVAVDKETSHEGELIWEGSHDSISGFDFADDEHVNVISVREEDIGGNAIEMTLGTDDTDLIFGTDGDNVIFGAGGDDLIVGGGGNDTILGGSGDDAILGGSGDDLLLGDFDEDVLRDEFAMSEEDIAAVLAGQLSDGSNNDLVIGGAGIDEVDGGEGNNVVISGGTDTGLEINGDGESNIQDIEDLIGRDLFEDEHWV